MLLSPLASVAKEPVWTAKPGPWGQLEVRAVYLEPPDSLLAVIAKPNSVTRWSFEQTTEQGVRELLTKVGVSAPIVGRLFASGRTLVSGNSVSLYPQVEDLTALSTEVRSALYVELAKYPANEYQRDPVYILGGDVDDWLSEVPLSSSQQQLFRSLLWKRGDALVFSDIQALLTLSKGPEDVSNVFRTMTRVRSLIVELQLPLKSDRKEFLDYWSAGQTDTPGLTFMHAITQRRAPQTIDITHFLPSLMRQRAYTFPQMELGLKGRFPDCHWTSLNFFNSVPKEFFLDTRLAAEHLLANYTTVEAPYRFGDVLCFLDNGQGLHTCVFIADDIVLTKNGDSILAPWAMMQIKDVESVYRRSASTRIQGYRLKK
jgi:hypothetical protein